MGSSLGALPRLPGTLMQCNALTRPHTRAQEKKRGPEWNVHISGAPNRLRRETAFMCNIRFRNDLPEVGAAQQCVHLSVGGWAGGRGQAGSLAMPLAAVAAQLPPLVLPPSG